MYSRIPSYPLITHDPYFSIWSPSDHLNDAQTVSWTGKAMPLNGTISVDGTVFRFLGDRQSLPVIEQVSAEITATQTRYTFSNSQIELGVSFAQHFDLKDLQSISEPITYLSFVVRSRDHQAHDVHLELDFDGAITYESLTDNRLITRQFEIGQTQEVFLGKARQTPLNSSGDLINIDWGYLYLATTLSADSQVSAYQKWNQQGLRAQFDLSTASEKKAQLLVAYDDLHAINYFGQATNAYWKQAEPSMPALLDKRLQSFDAIVNDCYRIDQQIGQLAATVGADNYELICATAYRQAIAAHKLIRDENGEIVFLSKECNSNGCIGTVDVSYPSIPLFLAFNPELVAGMMRPIFRFAKLPAWPFDFAPHDVGRYPDATGQVYGMNRPDDVDDGTMLREYDTVGEYYQYPANADLYNFDYQMPIEESGDMIIMASAVELLQAGDFLEQHFDQLWQWSKFLVAHGQDPGNQLCTDDFAGHLAHNVNLSLKAIVALAMFGKALLTAGIHQDEANELITQARKMAAIWTETAQSQSDTRLAFDQPDSWALKYNLIWDKLFGLGLFDAQISQKEIQRYLQQLNDYGTPLDKRATYTKVDWLMWVASLTTERHDFDQFTQSVVRFLNETPDRQPFSDWYDTKSAKMVAFKNRSVIGGVFMPMLAKILQSQA